MITHVVLMKFKPENREVHVRRAHELLLSMVGKVECLRHLEVGLNFTESSRACDLALVTRFEEREALAEYAEHPVHLEVKAFLQRVTESTFVADYENSTD